MLPGSCSGRLVRARALAVPRGINDQRKSTPDPASPQRPDSAYSASDGNAALPTLFARSRSFDRITWAGRHYSLRVQQHHYGLFWK